MSDMNTGAWKAALAGLLHDVGKLYQRAYWDAERQPHTAWTEAFVKGLRDYGLEDADRIAHAASHHHEREPKGWKPDDALSWAITLADNYASREREAGDGGGQLPPRVPLAPVFSRVVLEGERPCRHEDGRAYALSPLRVTNLFPTGKPALVYTELVEQLETRLNELKARVARASLEADALLGNLNAFLLEAAWAVPSDTQSEPDVSLYDHLRLTAAIAAALWAYHEENDGEVRVDALRDEAPKKFLLVAGDIGGIQNHIYRIRETSLAGVGAVAKRLRARSLEVALATETFALDVLKRAGLPFLNRVLSAGGRFTLLLPNTEAARQVLSEARRRWQEWALERGGTLLPAIAWLPFEAEEFAEFSKLLMQVGLRLAEAKLRPFESVAKRALPLAKEPVSLRPCPVCDALPASGVDADGNPEPCDRCKAEEAIGRSLPHLPVIGLSERKPSKAHYPFPGLHAVPGSDGSFLYRSRLDFAPDDRAFEVRPLTGRVPTVKDAIGVLAQEDGFDYQDWLQRVGLGEELDADEGRTLTFGELAHLAEGAPLIGVLMLDADRMGEVFIRGLPQSLQTPSRVASLSRMLELFFGFLSVELMREPAQFQTLLEWGAGKKRRAERFRLIYSVYAGGDDVFLIGPWDALLHYAVELERLYRLYTGDHACFTLSGGFVLAKPHTPVPVLADRVQEAERRAKNAGRNRLALFGVEVPWQELPELLDRGERLFRHLTDGDLPKGIVHRLLSLWAVYRRWRDAGDPSGLRYKPLLFYQRRNEGVKKLWKEFFEELMNHDSPAMRYLPVWVQYAAYARRGEKDA